MFVRPDELRNASLEELDPESAVPQWRIPAERMKVGEEQVVQLATQAVALLRELQHCTGPRGLLFHGIGCGVRPISDNTIHAALRGLGCRRGELLASGFLEMASFVLTDLGYAPDTIQLQLARAERNKVPAADSRAQHLIGRRTMMQIWADHLDTLRAAGV